MPENLVVVRSFGDAPSVRALLRDEGSRVVVCRPQNASVIAAGVMPEPMLGISRDDVFSYDEAVAKKIDNGETIDWSRLRPLHIKK